MVVFTYLQSHVCNQGVAWPALKVLYSLAQFNHSDYYKYNNT
ncbi:hypothetical protein PCARR_a3604 [Pseudoalteromonas carrageenovora IAM 12662]|uniref:Transposase n=1 Tax=Pseudoalteromonas carrageenovora IAM 12662 TaxID=1314868 RepID=A0ABR9EQD9_PSEVC|nr:hypothetical protein [Pseudoalteromonas carrageenovora IAM 12662]